MILPAFISTHCDKSIGISEFIAAKPTKPFRCRGKRESCNIGCGLSDQDNRLNIIRVIVGTVTEHSEESPHELLVTAVQ
jgi:hypothetical protein